MTQQINRDIIQEMKGEIIIKKVATFNVIDEDLQFVLEQNKNANFWCSIKKKENINIVNAYYVERNN